MSCLHTSELSCACVPNSVMSVSVNATELDDDISQQGCKDIKEGETVTKVKISSKMSTCT